VSKKSQRHKEFSKKYNEHVHEKRQRAGLEPLPPWERIKKSKRIEDFATARDLEALIFDCNNLIEKGLPRLELEGVRSVFVELLLTLSSIQASKAKNKAVRDQIYSRMQKAIEDLEAIKRNGVLN
jgi:hypothetical protein